MFWLKRGVLCAISLNKRSVLAFRSARLFVFGVRGFFSFLFSGRVGRMRYATRGVVRWWWWCCAACFPLSRRNPRGGLYVPRLSRRRSVRTCLFHYSQVGSVKNLCWIGSLFTAGYFVRAAATRERERKRVPPRALYACSLFSSLRLCCCAVVLALRRVASFTRYFDPFFLFAFLLYFPPRTRSGKTAATRHILQSSVQCY